MIMETSKKDSQYTIKRIGGYLHKVIPIMDHTGKVIHHVVTPFAVELKPRDILQIIIGASVLAIPIGFTEEAWILGRALPMKNVIMLMVISIIFIATFVYFNMYRYHLRDHIVEYIKRITAIYILSLIVVGILLTVIQKCSWGVDNVLAIKRIIIATFPSAMAATITDTIK
jgi:uncharacterized membrane protein